MPTGEGRGVTKIEKELDQLVKLAWSAALSNSGIMFDPMAEYKRQEYAEALAKFRGTLMALREKAAAYDRINTPEIDDFLSAVKNEALHQRERWGGDQDGGKADADWFWLVGYLAGKALHDVKGKRLHHIITTGAALLNWHAHAIGTYARMRPGIDPTTTFPAKAENGTA